jgi:putative phosphoesterase
VVRLALISDIHGNRVALDAVLADLAGRAVEEVVCLGDIAAGGPQPREVIARLRELRCQVVRGNADDWLLAGLPPGRSGETRRLMDVVAWARDRLTASDCDYLAALPATLGVTAGELDLFCFHGSPGASTDSVLPTTPAAELDRLLADVPAARVFASGHTHLQMLRSHRAALLVNPGSIGLPLGALSAGDPPLPTCAEYAIVTVGTDELEIVHRRLPIDVNALVAATAAMPHPSWARDLETRIARWNARA